VVFTREELRFSALEINLVSSAEIDLEDGTSIVVDGHDGTSKSCAVVLRVTEEGEMVVGLG
jgi:hypothetical protein